MVVAGLRQLLLLLTGALLAVLIGDSEAMMVPSGPPPDGFTLTEGDILVPKASAHARMQRKIVKRGVRMWPRNAEARLVVPYVITAGVNTYLVHKSVSHWQDLTCAQFAEYGSEDEAPKPFVRYRAANMCASSVGLVNKTAENDIFLSELCPIQSVIHETGHRLGFIHEQSRSDRGDFIDIVYDNIEAGMQKNFLIYGMTVNYSVPYDFSSIMHYDTMAFSNGKGPTIVTRNPLYQEILGEHFSLGGLSFMDAKIFNIAYGCIEDWEKACAGEVGGSCLHEGYIVSKQGRCGCACPLGTSGLRCEVKSLEYNDALLHHLSPLSAKVTEPTIIDTRERVGDVNGDYQRKGVRFTKVIIAPVCHRVALTVARQQMVDRFGDACLFDYVQIRLSNSTADAGNTFCGTELVPGQKFESVAQTMVVHVRTTTRGDFAAAVAFERLSDCLG